MTHNPPSQPTTLHRPPSIVALAGGVGGAKLADGLAQILPPERLTIIVNTGDDFVHWGLNISPDLDTVCYTLAGLANPLTGWGRKDETWHVFAQMERLGAETWFRLGDKDLATHLERTRRLSNGESLSSITRDFCARWGIRHTILPMSDAPVRTIVETVEFGELPFQEYFVHQRCEPTVRGFRFEGIERARPASGVMEAIQQADALVICPSNPWVSIDPILRIISPLLAEGRPSVRVAVSPIIGGQAVKGPAAKMFRELGIEPSALAVARHYGRTLLTGFVLDESDSDLAADVQALGIHPAVTQTLMKTSDDRRQLAQDVLHLIEQFV
ncbi:MAG: 2-phospho-L-lactate transferase [Anaerolineales bacterium]|nr:2-phospho-L-lactate transferase [Anaerolineales bacterium]MCX7754858.1 2-phospho-L-lactate transferase [Anaerolineales bacterium]MDW8278714.1 2-phospho-L-lactate transferase [Anaerolineales bacterium]